jgi:hypothetical protein
MREIKFRAWDKEEKEMLDWHNWCIEIKDAIPNDAGDEWYERCIVMQYTGFKDIGHTTLGKKHAHAD